MKTLPQISEAEFEVMKIVWEHRTHQHRFYDGNLSNMLSAYIDHDKLSETEINTLRSLLSGDAQKKGN